LGKLGIEFDLAPGDYKPSKAKTFSLDEVIKKGEQVFFNAKKRKPVDLGDLKKSLNEALEKSEEDKK